MLCLRDGVRDDDPSVQRLLRVVENADSLTALILAAWQVARVLAVHVIEAVLAERARRPTAWPPVRCVGRPCGVRARRTPDHERVWLDPVATTGGTLSQGCTIPQVAPWTTRWACSRSSGRAGNSSIWGVPSVFVPFATAARLLGWYSGGTVSPQAVWGWVQAAGQRAMQTLQDHLHALAHGDLPAREALAADLAAAPWVLGADGVMVPFRPAGGQPTGKTRWQEIKVGVLARLGQHRTRTGKVVTELHARRLVAVLGDVEALKPRLWLEAVAGHSAGSQVLAQ